MRGKQPCPICYRFSRHIIKKHDSFQPFHLPFPRNRDKEIHFQKSMNNISCLSAPLPHADVPCRPATGKNGRESDLDHLLSNTSHPQSSTIHSTNQIGIDSSGYICGQAALSRGAMRCLGAEGIRRAPQGSHRALTRTTSGDQELQRTKQNARWIIQYVCQLHFLKHVKQIL